MLREVGREGGREVFGSGFGEGGRETEKVGGGGVVGEDSVR